MSAESPEADANLAWYLRFFCEAVECFTTSFENMQKGEFSKAWAQLEQAEIALATLLGNPFCGELNSRASFLKEQVSEFQKLFPYKFFGSPELLIGRLICSLCGDQMPPRGRCSHRTNKVYAGRLCVREAHEVAIVGFSLVTKPVQKSSVVFMGDDTSLAYDPIRYVLQLVRGPYALWRVHETLAYWPHQMFPDTKGVDLCPCESGQTYEACCKERKGVLRPHLVIELPSKPADLDIPPTILVANGNRYLAKES